jgi:hypothetical protein
MRLGFFAAPRPPVLTVGDIATTLRSFTLARRRAILFACEMDLDIDTVVLLDWQTGGRLIGDRKGLARALFYAQPRHLHLNYVFWEQLEDMEQAAPLFGLDRQVSAQIPDFPAFRARYRGMALYDGSVECQAFLTAFARARAPEPA